MQLHYSQSGQKSTTLLASVRPNQPKTIALTALVSILTLSLSTASSWAQIVPDQTLPENSIILEQGNTSRIEGGTTAGRNLFHSFQTFSIDTGRTVFFNNALTIQNIITRVTGGTVSNIDGLIQANGNANLFLLNPKGFVFGPNAALDVGGSFLASSASQLNFADGSRLSATAAGSPSVLSVSVPVGLGFGSEVGSIRTLGQESDCNSCTPVGLQVKPGNTLALLGGGLVLNNSQLSAPGGRVELGSVAPNSGVRLAPTPRGWAIGYEGVQTFGDLTFSNQAKVDVSGLGAGEIQVVGDRIALGQGSALIANTLGNEDGGQIDIRANQISLQEGAFVSAFTFGEGQGGQINVSATDMIQVTGTGNFSELQQRLISRSLGPDDFRNGFFTSSFGPGTGGSLTIDTGKLILENGALISTSVFDSGDGGNLRINALDSVEIINAGVGSISSDSANAGNLMIDTGRLIVRDGGIAATTTFGIGQGGTLTVNASESVELLRTPIGAVFPTGLFSTSFGNGDAGNIEISTRRLIVQDGADISAATLIAGGDGGDIHIDASESVEVIGTNASGISSLVNTETESFGDAGDVRINTGRLTILDGARVSAATLAAGRGGNVTVNARESVEVSGRSSDGRIPSGLGAGSGVEGDIFTVSNRIGEPLNPTGPGGELSITTREFVVSNGGIVAASSLGEGDGGNLSVIAETLNLENGAAITAATALGEGGGNIDLQVQHLRLRGSQISAAAGGSGNGGNLSVNAQTITALDGSEFTASAIAGNGGNVQINTQGLFQSLDSEITASSELGIDGVVAVNTSDIELQNALTALSGNFVSPDQVVADSCLARRNVQRGSFTVTGTGGLPRTPFEAIRGRYSLSDVQSIEGDGPVSAQPVRLDSTIWKVGDPIQEVQGIVRTPDGRTLLGTNVQLRAIANAQALICQD